MYLFVYSEYWNRMEIMNFIEVVAIAWITKEAFYFKKHIYFLCIFSH